MTEERPLTSQIALSLTPSVTCTAHYSFGDLMALLDAAADLLSLETMSLTISKKLRCGCALWLEASDPQSMGATPDS